MNRQHTFKVYGNNTGDYLLNVTDLRYENNVCNRNNLSPAGSKTIITITLKISRHGVPSPFTYDSYQGCPP